MFYYIVLCIIPELRRPNDPLFLQHPVILGLQMLDHFSGAHIWLRIATTIRSRSPRCIPSNERTGTSCSRRGVRGCVHISGSHVFYPVPSCALLCSHVLLMCSAAVLVSIPTVRSDHMRS